LSASLDVLFINPGDTRKIYQHLSNSFSAIEPPVFAATFATFLRKKGCSVAIFDMPAEGRSTKEVAEVAIMLKPLLVVIAVYGFQPSASSQNMPATREICNNIKALNSEIKILLTGTHPAALPMKTLTEESIDFVCDGEGPITIHEVVQALKVGDGDWSKVRGLWYWGGVHPFKMVRSNVSAPLVENVDEEMPGLAWDLLPMGKYRAHNWHCNYGDMVSRMPYASILTSFGCPFRCEFCCIQAPFKSGERVMGYKSEVNSYRLRSLEAVMKEIHCVVQVYGIKNIKIHDEMFVLHPKHVLGIAEAIKDRYGDSLNIWAYARIDTTKPVFLDALRSAGFKWLGIGIESGSAHVREGADKSFSDNDIRKVCERVKSAGINIGGNFIFGLPDDTHETMNETFALALEIMPEMANFYSAMAYPGSRLHSWARERGWPLPEDVDKGGPGWIGYSQHSRETFPLRTEKVDACDVLKRRDSAFIEYYTNPSYLRMVDSIFGKNAVSHIKEMTSLPSLKRVLFEKKD